MMRKLYLLGIALLLLAGNTLTAPPPAIHEGPVDRDGCHRDSQDRRHCH